MLTSQPAARVNFSESVMAYSLENAVLICIFLVTCYVFAIIVLNNHFRIFLLGWCLFVLAGFHLWLSY